MDRWHRGLHVVTGKGGVGKSTVAAAIALAAVDDGARVLAIELGTSAGLSRICGVTAAAPGAIVATPAGFSLAWFDGATALAEYLTRRVRLGRMGERLLEHPLFRAFASAAPGLRELMAVGKIRDELVLQGRWDVVVVDAGASGHALEHLRMPAAAARAFGSGLVHREAEKNAALLADPRRCAVHVVATPEEMPLREAAQTVGALRAVGIAVGAVIVNLCRPRAPLGIDVAIAALPDGAVARIARRARAWERIQERGIAALERDTAIAATRLPRVWTPEPLGLARALAPLVRAADVEEAA